MSSLECFLLAKFCEHDGIIIVETVDILQNVKTSKPIFLYVCGEGELESSYSPMAQWHMQAVVLCRSK